MAESSALFAAIGHRNPTLCRIAAESGGTVHVGDVCDGASIARFAVDMDIDIALVSSDDPLEAGVVDALIDAGIRTVGPTRSGAEIEWNKDFSRHVVHEVAPAANPTFAIARTEAEARRAVSVVGEAGAVAIKPLGLAGGKGVKVVGPHLADNAAALAYALEIIDTGRSGGGVVVEERVLAPEFTIQAMTDGVTVVIPPATYDYPYRFAGDTGPGTGGMGTCTLPGGLLPFIDAATYDEACDIVRATIDLLARQGRPFSGCLNAGFFATDHGLRVIEFNARFGDPEGINIMALITSDWMDALEAIEAHELDDGTISLNDAASLVTYLVSPEYAIGQSTGHRFTVDEAAIEQAGAYALFSAAVDAGDGTFETVGTSRALAIVTTSPTIDEARRATRQAIEVGVSGDLEWRDDIGTFPPQ